LWGYLRGGCTRLFELSKLVKPSGAPGLQDQKDDHLPANAPTVRTENQ
jgi:hypothetical protein